MPKPTKRKGANTPKPSTPKPPTPQSSIPAPFTTTPASLLPFLSTLPKNHIYITTLDPHPRAFKRRLFAVPLLLNIFIAIVLIYRFNRALPTYFGIAIGVLGYETPHKVDVKNSNAATLLEIGGGRAMMFLGDFMLARFVGMWPWDFFLGRGEMASPVGWRRWVGFRDVEIIVRKSRRWDVELFEKDGEEDDFGRRKEGRWLEEGKEGRVMEERIGSAVSKEWVRDKSGYLMMDKNWDLFFAGMIEAHAHVDAGKNKMEEFRTSVFIFTESTGWLVWEVWKEHEEWRGDEGTRKLQRIKDKLTGAGKENLFFRWIEVVQSETSQPGPFTVEKQQKAVQKIREEFEEQSVDFDDFWKDVGGVESMPGMEITS